MYQGRSWLSPFRNWALYFACIKKMYFCAMYDAREFVIEKSYDEVIGN